MNVERAPIVDVRSQAVVTVTSDSGEIAVRFGIRLKNMIVRFELDEADARAIGAKFKEGAEMAELEAHGRREWPAKHAAN